MKEDLILYKLERAKETLEEAKLMFETKHYNAAFNRLYYTMYYAISAYLVKIDKYSKTHKGVRVIMHNDLIKAGLLSDDIGRVYDELFDTRDECDYADFVVFKKEDVLPFIEKIEKSIYEIEKHIGDL